MGSPACAAKLPDIQKPANARSPVGRQRLGVKIRFPLSRKGLAGHDARLRRLFLVGFAKSGSVIFS